MQTSPLRAPNVSAWPLTDAALLRGRTTRALYDDWDARRGDRPYPAWHEMNLMELWRIAGCLGVKDVIDGGADFRNRFWGTRLTETTGIEGTGRTSAQLYGASSETNFVNYRWVVETAAPVVVYRRLTFVKSHEYITYEALHLPLGPDGGPVSQVISGFDFDCAVDDILAAAS